MLTLILTNIIETNILTTLCSGVVLPLLYFENPLSDSLKQDLHQLELVEQNKTSWGILENLVQSINAHNFWWDEHEEAIFNTWLENHQKTVYDL